MMFPSIIASGVGAPRRRFPVPPPPADDWAVRSAGALLADRLQDATKLVTPPTFVDPTHWLHSATADHVSLDTSIKPNGSNGSWRFESRPTDTPNCGLAGIYFGDRATYGNGSTFWLSVRVRANAAQAYYPWPFAGNGGSHKIFIISSAPSSNVPNEIVCQMFSRSNLFGGYWQDGVSSAVNVYDSGGGIATACSGSDIRWQLGINRGANPLTGNDPDTGSAWSACAQDRARYGGLFSSRSLAQPRDGYGDPLSGGFRQVPDEWITLICRVTVGTFGSSNSRWTLWAARDGQAPELLWDKTSIRLGNALPYDTFWLTPYCSDRTSGGPGVSARTNNITGTTLYVPGLDTATGDGTLEYNASTQRFRWAAAGDTFGTARGFSAANGILTINVNSAAAGDRYLVLKVDPASLPTSGVVTDTVTIASGRPMGYTWYADVIVSNSIINAPGGFAPVG